MNPITEILEQSQPGDVNAADRLLPLVYQELRRLATHKLANESAGQTLQPTSLVHEAWLRLKGDENHQWNSRGHFFGAAAEAMRRILIENARRKKALKHGGGQERCDIQEVEIASVVPDEELLAVSEALDKFARRDPQKAELVKLRYFVGMTIEETAEIMEISAPTAKRWWNYSRAWFRTEIANHQ